MSVWRIDIIYPDAPGGPWIATTESLTTGSMPETPTWHLATDGAALVKLLDALKLLHGQTFDGGPTTLDYLPAPASEPSAEQPSAPPAAGNSPSRVPLRGLALDPPGLPRGRRSRSPRRPPPPQTPLGPHRRGVTGSGSLCWRAARPPDHRSRDPARGPSDRQARSLRSRWVAYLAFRSTIV